MALAKKIADRIVFLHKGQVVFFDTPAKMEQSELEIVREFLALDSLDLEYWRGGQHPRPPMPSQ
jgi:phospholipid/cholesterol/gamma-HCH transport system ATP-binding protein